MRADHGSAWRTYTLYLPRVVPSTNPSFRSALCRCLVSRYGLTSIQPVLAADAVPRTVGVAEAACAAALR